MERKRNELSGKVVHLIRRLQEANDPQVTLSVIITMIKGLYEVITIFEDQLIQQTKASKVVNDRK